MKRIPESELVLNSKGRIYHLDLAPEDLAPNVLLVGDPGRADLVASFFDNITYSGQNREICTRTGTFQKKDISVISTGMGTDNIDIVINELDALVNIDLKKRVHKKEKQSLNLVRIGTSGGLQPFMDVNTFLFSSHGIGLDGLLHYYEGSDGFRDTTIEQMLVSNISWPERWPKPYVVEADSDLMHRISDKYMQGMTLTASGFYGPQGRVLRLPLHYPDFNQRVESFAFRGNRICNFEMETSALYGLSKMLGHKALTACVIIANRSTKNFSKNYQPAMKKLIKHVLTKI
ncbi:MAG: nucleoside phosphorylase [Bacteroidales bacterium]|nr:nucleoside phosphorylase [Bacteroidales bacterium]